MKRWSKDILLFFPNAVFVLKNIIGFGRVRFHKEALSTKIKKIVHNMGESQYRLTLEHCDFLSDLAQP